MRTRQILALKSIMPETLFGEAGVFRGRSFNLYQFRLISLESSTQYLVSFTTDAANRIARNAGEGNGLEAWRRLRSEYDPTSSMRRVAILQQVQKPTVLSAS